jgi:hypothetical protein
MKKWQSGLLVIGLGFALQIVGRLLGKVPLASTNVVFAGAIFCIMLVATAVIIFGLIRLLLGLITRS